MADIEHEARAEAEAIMSEARERVGITVREQQRYIEGYIAGASRPASHATSEADECSCRGEYITALDLVDGCKCGRLKPFHEMTDEEVNVAASPATREAVTEREPYTPSLDEIVMGKTHLGDNFWRELSEDEVRRGIEAVRQEEREKAAQVVERYWPKFTGVNLPNIVRAQRKEQDRG